MNDLTPHQQHLVDTREPGVTREQALRYPVVTHRDMHDQPLAVGDTVRYGGVEGTVLILEKWMNGPGGDDWSPGLYVSNVGQWGGCKAVRAGDVVKLR